MIEIDELTYAAIITISFPNNPEPTQVSVKLAPPDLLETAVAADQIKTVKMLRDCTLADLQRYAVALEESVWEQYEKITLLDFANEEGGHIKINVINDKERPLPAAEAWLEGAAIVLPESAIPAEEELPEAEVELVEEELAVAEAPSAETAVEATDTEPEGADSETDADETEADDAEEAEAAVEAVVPEVEEAIDEIDLLDDIQIVVSEPEPIHEERESGERTEVAEAVDPLERAVAKAQVRMAGQILPLDAFTHSAVDILFDEDAFEDAKEHSLSSLRREVAGVLVGPHPEKQPNGRYVVHVTDAIAAKYTRMQGASVTYTPESWRYVNDKLMEMYPNDEAVIVGWYHTHPGFGIFLSNMDLFIHHNFFTQKWHIALVLDPVGKRSGFFSWNKRQSQVEAYNFPWPYWAHGSW